MKVFLSWSGELSHKIACAFRDWLPNVLQYVQPYVSSEDIDKGTRWSTDIAKELEASVFGILMITKDNYEASWVSFEAGALSKTVDKSKVAPFLFNMKRAELQGPLLQFQSTIFDHDDIFKLIQSINKSASQEESLDEQRLNKIFPVWWPELKTQLEKLQSIEPTKKSEPKQNQIEKYTSILEEILDITRNQYKIMNSPETFLPANYLHSVLGVNTNVGLSRRERERIEEQLMYIKRLRDMFNKPPIIDETNPKNMIFVFDEREWADIKGLLTFIKEISDYLKHINQRESENFIRFRKSNA